MKRWLGKYFAGFMQRREVVVTPLAALFVSYAEFQPDEFAGAADELDILLDFFIQFLAWNVLVSSLPVWLQPSQAEHHISWVFTSSLFSPSLALSGSTPLCQRMRVAPDSGPKEAARRGSVSLC